MVQSMELQIVRLSATWGLLIPGQTQLVQGILYAVQSD